MHICCFYNNCVCICIIVYTVILICAYGHLKHGKWKLFTGEIKRGYLCFSQDKFRLCGAKVERSVFLFKKAVLIAKRKEEGDLIVKAFIMVRCPRIKWFSFNGPEGSQFMKNCILLKSNMLSIWSYFASSICFIWSAFSL